MKSTILASAMLAAAGIGLAACGQGAKQAQQTSVAPEGMPGITVSDGRLVLPAVKGNPGAVYFNVDYTGDDVAMIRAVHVDGAKTATLHETVTGPNGVSQMQEMLNVKVNKGTTLKFEPGGKHVMAMDLDPSLKVGDTTEVTLTFLGGDKVSFPAKVEAPGSQN